MKLYVAVYNRIKVIDGRRKVSFCLPFECPNNINQITLSPCGRYIAVVDSQSLCTLLTVGGQILKHAFFSTKIVNVAFSEDSRFVCAGMRDRLVLFKLMPDFQLIQVLVKFCDRPVNMTFSGTNLVVQTAGPVQILALEYLMGAEIRTYKQMQECKQRCVDRELFPLGAPSGVFCLQDKLLVVLQTGLVQVFGFQEEPQEYQLER